MIQVQVHDVRQRSEDGFVARGGLWVVVQFVLLWLVPVVPVVTRHLVPCPWTGQMAVGYGLLVLGAAEVLAGALRLGRNLTPMPKPIAGGPLRTDGIYGVVRHPVYGGLSAACLGYCLTGTSLVAALYGLLMCAFFDRKASAEERWLRTAFPDYDAYTRRVKKLIPFVY